MADVTISTSFDEGDSLIEKCGFGGGFYTGTVTFDGGNYVANGIALDLSKKFPKGIAFIIFEQTSGYLPVYNRTSGKVEVWCGDYSASADGPHAQVTAGVALNLTARFLAIGK